MDKSAFTKGFLFRDFMTQSRFSVSDVRLTC